jgi:hypothetical protein
MWGNLHAGAEESLLPTGFPTSSTEIINQWQTTAPSDTSLNPNAYQRQRLSSSLSDLARCCDCTRFAACLSATQSRFKCCNTGRDCVSCCPGLTKCRNHWSQAIVCTPPPPGHGRCLLPPHLSGKSCHRDGAGHTGPLCDDTTRPWPRQLGNGGPPHHLT